MRFSLILCLFLATLSVICVFASAHSGHTHGHTHSHAHGDVGHSHSSAPANSNVRTKDRPPASTTKSAKKQIKPEFHWSELVPDNGPWVNAIVATAIVGLVPIAFLMLVPTAFVSPSVLKVFVSFAIGGMLGDVFLHLLPHAIDPHDHSAPAGDGHAGHSHSHSHADDHSAELDEHSHMRGIVVGLWVLAGMLAFFVIEKIARMRTAAAGGRAGGHSHSHGGGAHDHAHDDGDAPDGHVGDLAAVVEPAPSAGSANQPRSRPAARRKEAKAGGAARGRSASEEQSAKDSMAGVLNIIADAAHNFTDGMAMAASFSASYKLGMTTTVAVFFHEIPHEIGDYAILVQSGYSHGRAMLVQCFTALGALAGTIFGLAFAAYGDTVKSWMLPFTAGGFIYVATVGIIPTLLEDTNVKQSLYEILAMFVGVAMMVLIAVYE